MRLIDVDALKDQCKMADDCNSCPREARECGRVVEFTRMDFCAFLDDAPTYDAPAWVPITEEIPGPQDLVLAYSAEHQAVLYGTVEGNDYDGYFAVSENGDRKLLNVTHWMAVPPPSGL